MADEDGADPDDENGHGFNAAAWAPDNCSYGLFYLMVIRQGLDPEKLTKPAEVEDLKFMDIRTISRWASGKKHRDSAEAEEESDYVSEGEPYEESDVAQWPGKKASWWRVHSSLGEELVVREGLSLMSAELSRMSPGDAVQQAGVARMLWHGRCRGCIRLPVKPRGWVTADATRAGGPRYLVSSSAPRWRVVYTSSNPNDSGVIVRAEPELDSDEVTAIYLGDIVEQAGPSETRGQGIVRMPVAAVISYSGRKDGETEAAASTQRQTVSGWVTVDASSAGGPVFFKLVPEVDNKRRRHRNVNRS